jgi:hypothetical protein
MALIIVSTTIPLAGDDGVPESKGAHLTALHPDATPRRRKWRGAGNYEWQKI